MEIEQKYRRTYKTDKSEVPNPYQTPVESPPVGTVASPFEKLLKIALSKPSLALMDQCISSGTRFLLVILVGRLAGQSPLGIYSLAMGVTIIIGTAQEALLCRPLMVFSNQMTGTRKSIYSGSVLVQMAMLVLGSVFFALIGHLVSNHFFVIKPEFRMFSLLLAVALPGVLMWEFARRYAFARLDMTSAVLIDTGLGLFQVLGILGVFFLTDGLTAVSALLIAGLAGIMIGSLGILTRRKDFIVDRKSLIPDAIMNWHFGKWMFLGQIVGLVQSYAISYLLAFRVGTEATGVLTACQTLVLLSNPLLLGIGNWLGPRSAHLFTDGGMESTRSLIRKVNILLVILLLAFWLVLFLFGEQIVTLAFGSDYAGHGTMMGILGLTAVGFGLQITGSQGLAAIHHPKIMTLGCVIGAMVSISSFFPLTEWWGLNGAAIALGLGSLATGFMHYFGFEWIASRNSSEDVPVKANQA